MAVSTLIAQVGRVWAQHRRWGIKAGIGATLAGASSRSGLMNWPVIILDDHDPARMDILPQVAAR